MIRCCHLVGAGSRFSKIQNMNLVTNSDGILFCQANLKEGHVVIGEAGCTIAVSYTHLTLPTIYSV